MQATFLQGALFMLPKEKIIELVKQGSWQRLKYALETDPQLIHFVNEEGSSLLHLAIEFHQIKCVRVLLMQPELDLKKTNADGKTASALACEVQGDQSENIRVCIGLVEAIQNNNFTALEKILNNEKDKYKDEDENEELTCYEDEENYEFFKEVFGDEGNKLLLLHLAIVFNRFNFIKILAQFSTTMIGVCTDQAFLKKVRDALLANEEILNDLANYFPKVFLNIALSDLRFQSFLSALIKKDANSNDPFSNARKEIYLFLKSHNESTLLHFSAAVGDRDMTQSLLKISDYSDKFVEEQNTDQKTAADLTQDKHIQSSLRAPSLINQMRYSNEDLEAMKTHFSSQDLYGNTLLHLAIQAGRVDHVRSLIEENLFLIDKKNQEGLTPLVMAKNQLEKMKKLLKNPYASEEEKSDQKKLWKFSFEIYHHIKKTKDKKNKKESALFQACRKSGNNQCLVDFVSNLQGVFSITPQEEDLAVKDYQEAANYAIRINHFPVFKSLIKAHPSILNHSDLKKNLLHQAIQYGRVDMVLHLLKNYSDLFFDKDSDIEISPPRAELVAISEGNIPKLKKLLAANPDLLNQQDDSGATLLHYAVASHQERMVQFLLSQAQIDVESKDHNQKTPLELAEIFFKNAEESPILIELRSFKNNRDFQYHNFKAEIMAKQHNLEKEQKSLIANVSRQKQKIVFLRKILEVAEKKPKEMLSDVIYAALNQLECAKNQPFFLFDVEFSFQEGNNKTGFCYEEIISKGILSHQTRNLLYHIASNSPKQAIDKINRYVEKLDESIKRKKRRIQLLDTILRVVTASNIPLNEVMSSLKTNLANKEKNFKIGAIEFSSFSAEDLSYQTRFSLYTFFRFDKEATIKKITARKSHLELDTLQQTKKDFFEKVVAESSANTNIVDLNQKITKELKNSDAQSKILQGFFSTHARDLISDIQKTAHNAQKNR